MKTSTLLTALTCAALLTACGGAPSEKEMHSAVQKQVDSANAQIGSIGSAFGQPGAAVGDKLKTTLHDFKKIGCKSDGENAYLCDVEIDIEAPFIGRSKQVTPMRFVKASDGWTVAQ